MACNRIKKKPSLVCIGDLSSSIILQNRAISTPVGDGVDYGETFTTNTTAWARIDTVSGETIFDDTNTERDVTHRFYIRYIDGITSETWIEYDSIKFDILDVENLNEEGRFLRLRAAKRGVKTSDVNLS